MLTPMEPPSATCRAIGRRLRDLRIQSRLRQRDVAERSGIPVSTYRLMERLGSGSLENFVKVADLLGASESAVEAAYIEMAARAGLRVPATKQIPAPDGPGVFAARRFDRKGNQRIHVQSLCAILEASLGLTAIGYRQFLLATRQVMNDAAEVAEAFRRAAFNVLAYNRDDHSKQHSFAMDRSGRWQLTPAYDLTFTPRPGGEQPDGC